MLSSAFGRIGVRSAWRKAGTGTPAQASRTSGNTNFTANTMACNRALIRRTLPAVDFLLNWELPDELITRYKETLVPESSSLWPITMTASTLDSKHQPWNAAAIGPHRDVIGTCWLARRGSRGYGSV